MNVFKTKDFYDLEFERTNLLVRFNSEDYYYRGYQEINENDKQAILCRLSDRQIILLNFSKYKIIKKTLLPLSINNVLVESNQIVEK